MTTSDDPVQAEQTIVICPLGPPLSRSAGVRYAWCGECQCVRKSTKDCPMIEAQREDAP